MKRQLSYITLQKKFGGKWIALTEDRTKVLAATEKLDQLHKNLEKKKIDTGKVIFSKVAKYGTVSVYLKQN